MISLSSEEVIDSDSVSSSTHSIINQQKTKTIITGTLASTLLGLTYGSIHSVRHNLSPTFPVISTAFKTTTFGLTFFTFRQCLVEPILNPTSQTNLTTHNPHLVGVLPTFITATILGGSINGFLRGRHTIVRSSITTSLVCSSIQIVMNEINLFRIRLLSSNTPSQADWSSSENLSQTAENPSRDRSRFWERWIPLQRIPDEVWRKRLSEDLDFIESRRRSVSEEIDLIEKALKTKENSK